MLVCAGTASTPVWLETRLFMLQEEVVLIEGRRDEQNSVTLQRSVGNFE